jgi:flagellin
LAASNSTDISLLNSANSRVTVTGVDATGTISHSKGGGSFTATGEEFNYTDDSISLDGSIDPTLTPAVRATTTISHAAVNSGGLGSLSSTATNTIDLQLTGTVNGNTVTTNITGVNVYQLKNDSQYLVDLVNATSASSGVQASTTGASGNIVLSATTAGSGGSVSISATGATSNGDITAFNDGDTFSATVAGSNPATANNFDVTGGALFQIGPTVNFSNQINVNITSLDLATLGRNYSTTGNDALSSLKTGGNNSLDKADLTNAASIVDQAISEVATLRGKLGAIQKNAIDSNIRSLQTSLEQVTSAQSTIRDADFAVETAALTRSQILVQAGTSVLAIANQSPQNVLSLLGGR